MSSDVDICNVALSLVGSAAVVSAIDPADGSAAAGHCARFYPIARRQILELAELSWSKKRVALAELTNDSEAWGYLYALPSDCVKPLRILQSNVFAGTVVQQGAIFDHWWRAADALFNEYGSADFEREGMTLRANDPEAVLLYLTDVTDTGRFPPTFVTALAWQLAGYLAGPIIKGTDGMRVARANFEMARSMAGEMKASDANATSEEHEPVPDHIKARA